VNQAGRNDRYLTLLHCSDFYQLKCGVILTSESLLLVTGSMIGRNVCPIKLCGKTFRAYIYAIGIGGFVELSGFK